MERVCHEETVPPCQSHGPAGTGVTAVGHGPWGVWVSITRNQGRWRQSLSVHADSPEREAGGADQLAKVVPRAQQLHWTAGLPCPGLPCLGLGNGIPRSVLAGLTLHPSPAPSAAFWAPRTSLHSWEPSCRPPVRKSAHTWGCPGHGDKESGIRTRQPGAGSARGAEVTEKVADAIKGLRS